MAELRRQHEEFRERDFERYGSQQGWRGPRGDDDTDGRFRGREAREGRFMNDRETFDRDMDAQRFDREGQRGRSGDEDQFSRGRRDPGAPSYRDEGGRQRHGFGANRYEEMSRGFGGRAFEDTRFEERGRDDDWSTPYRRGRQEDDFGAGQRHASYGSDRDRQFMQDDRYGQTSNRSWGTSGLQSEQRSQVGKGPKNYKRSDDRIREEVCDRLTDDRMLDASEITVEVKDGDVTLSGTVASRDDKRRAEDLAERCSGVNDVTNQLRTRPQGQTGTRSGESGSTENAGSSQASTATGSTSTKNPRATAQN